MSQEKVYYLKPAPFFEETVKSIMADKATDELCHMFWTLAEKTSTHYRFNGYYHLKEDMISRGFMVCLKGFRNFKPFNKEGGIWTGDYVPEYHHTTCNNPFSYFNRFTWNECIQCIKEEYNQRNIINELRLENGFEADHGYEDVVRAKEAD